MNRLFCVNSELNFFAVYFVCFFETAQVDVDQNTPSAFQELSHSVFFTIAAPIYLFGSSHL